MFPYNVPKTACSKAYFCRHFITGIAISNPAESMNAPGLGPIIRPL